MATEATAWERPVQMGRDGHLVGVLAGPARTGTPSDEARPVVVFLNAGVLHRVGPHRLHVNLARRLAARGSTSLRLDLSGIGDSRAVPGALTFRESAVADTRGAMDDLGRELGASRFILFGLCSGADNALATAAADARVVGLVLLDPPAYVTPEARRRRILARVRQLGSARAVATWAAGRIVHRVRARVEAIATRGDDDPDRGRGDDDELVGGREIPPAAEFEAQVDALVARGVAILAVYSGALGVRYNHHDQVFEQFPGLRGKIDRVFFPAANHTFTELAAQAALCATVTAWIDRAGRTSARISR